jgi:hypothetical protein
LTHAACRSVSCRTLGRSPFGATASNGDGV